MMFIWIKKHLFTILISIIVLIGIVLRLKGLLTNSSMWHDECALAFNVLNKSWGDFFGKLNFLQIASPFFMIISKISVMLAKGDLLSTDFHLRLFPFLTSVVAFYVFYKICLKVFNSKLPTILAMILFALNPVLINYSFEFKPYSTDVLCVLIVLLIFLSVDFKKNSLKQIFIYGSILAVLMWISFISSIATLAGFLTLSFKKENPAMFSSLLVVPFISAFLCLKFYILNTFQKNIIGMSAFWQNEFVHKDFSNIYTLSRDNLYYFFSSVNISYLLLVILVILGIILFIKDKKWMFVSFSFLIISILIIFSMAHYYPFSRRLIIFLIPILILFVVKPIDMKNKILPALLLTFIIIPHFVFAFHFIKIKNINKSDFARETFQYLALKIKPEDKIFVNEASNAEFFYYNSFFDLKNEMIYEKNRPLKSLKSGSYWFYMPYDFNAQSENIKKTIIWVKSNGKIDYIINATQSTLFHANLN